MWSDHVEYIQLVKEDRGLGFSILDYLVRIIDMEHVFKAETLGYISWSIHFPPI
jgi:hypothetical protein